MIIQAAVKSKAFKKDFDKKNRLGLSELCGHLALDATNEADAALLTAMYRHCFGALDKNQKGSIKVFDESGKQIINYYFDVKTEQQERA